MYLAELLYWTYVLSCSILMPSWAFFKHSRIMLSLALLLIPVLLVCFLHHYITDPQYEDDHGIAVAGLFLTVPILSLLCQLVVLTVCKSTHSATRK